jgi:hypothetical protein
MGWSYFPELRRIPWNMEEIPALMLAYIGLVPEVKRLLLRRSKLNMK